MIDAQPFVTPDTSNVSLDSFSIYYVPNPGFPTNYLSASVMEWNPSNPSPAGTALWSSTLGSTTVGSTGFATPWGNWETYTFNTGGLLLDPTKTYALLAFQNPTADIGDSEPGLIAVASTIGGSIFGAKTYSSPIDPGLAILNNSAWGSSSNDISYSADFSPAQIPEPPVTALTLGFLSLFIAWRRRRAARAV